MNLHHYFIQEVGLR